MASKTRRKPASGGDSPATPEPSAPSLAGKFGLFIGLLLLILPAGWVQHDDTLDLFLCLLVVTGGALHLWRRSAGPGESALPLFAIPPLVLGLYLLILTMAGVSGYQPHASIIRLYLTGAIFILAYNAFGQATPTNLLLALRWLVFVIALAYFPMKQWEFLHGFQEERFRFTFWHPNALGCFLAVTFPFLLAHPWLPGQDRRSRSIGVLAVVIALLVAGATQSRLALLLMLGEAAILLPCLARAKMRFSWAKALASMLVVVGVLVAALAVFFGKGWMFNKFSGLWSGGEFGRLYMWRGVWDLLNDQPGQGLVGHGPGILYVESWSFPTAEYGYFGRAKADAFAHNLVLDWSLEGGLIGLLAFGALAILLLVPMARSLKEDAPVDRLILRSGLLVSALAALAFAQVSITSQFALVLTLVGIILGGMTRMLDMKPRTIPLRAGHFLILGILAAAAAAFHFPKVMSDCHLAKAARTFEEPGSAGGGSAHLRKSLDWDGDNVNAWYLRMLTSHQQGNRRAVTEAYREIDGRVPNFMAASLVQAANLAMQGKLAEALPVLDAHLEVNGYDFQSSCQFLTYAHYLKKPDVVDQGLERLVRAHLSAVSAKGGTPPTFTVTEGPEIVWTLEWEGREPVSMTRQEARERLFIGLKGNLGHDYPVVVGNTRRLIKALGFEERTLDKGQLGQ